MLEVHVSSWDEFLKQICRGCKPFLTGLVEEMARILVAPPSPTPTDGDEAYLHNIVQWMKHLLTSITWSSFRKRYLILSYVEILCAESSPNVWTDQLREILKERSPSESAGVLAITQNGSTHAKKKGADTDIEMEDEDKDNKIRFNEDSQSDVAVLRDFGWDFGEGPNLKAIGVA